MFAVRNADALIDGGRSVGRSLALCLAAVAALSGCMQQTAPKVAAWPFVGNDLRNTRDAHDEHVIGIGNVAQLQPLWTATLKGASQATPVSDGTFLYIPNSNGHLYRIDRKSGQIGLDIDLPTVLAIPGAAAKELAVTDHALFFGITNTAVVVAVDKDSGAMLWKTKIEDHPMSRITQPPLVVGDTLFVGVSGVGEEAAASAPGYRCCSFRGSVAALDIHTGKQLWKTYDLPPGFAGGSIWSRTPSFDVKRHSLYITTGNMYQAPPSVQECATKNKDDAVALGRCYPPDVWTNSILELNPDTGAIKWGFRAENYDIFTGSCQVPELGAGNCGGGQDFDFGNGAILWHVGGRDLVGAGQKSGMFWALDPDSGKVVWKRRVGPGGVNGGMEHGSATDDRRVYAAMADAKQVNRFPATYTLPSGQAIKYGSFAALDGATGKIDWQVPDPAGEKFPGNDKLCSVKSPREDCTGAFPKGPVSVANGVVYACSGAPQGPMYAFNAATGALLWSYDSGASCATGATIIDGTVYWVNSKTVNAFALPAKDAAH